MKRLITISDGNIELGVIPDLGGMVALLRLKGKPNVLKADESLWDKRPVVRRASVMAPKWEAHYGHIVWLGPQCEWWSQQSVNPKKAASRSAWPPDPYHNHGNFKLLKQTDTELVMEGPASVYSGVRLVKSIKIRNGKVYFKVSAQNIRPTPVSWDLWLNTRVDGSARCYAFVESMDSVRIDGRVNEINDMCTILHDRGYICIEPKAPSATKKKRWAKAFIKTDKEAMAAFTAEQALVVRFKKYPEEQIYPSQALVEIYNITTRNRRDAMTELEYHSPYKTLNPGETMEASQTWELYPFADPTHESCVDFMNKVL